ncbi:Ribonuclease H-like domain containing protein [Elaphomyces granulatus]
MEQEYLSVFRALLLGWIVNDNIAFRKVDSKNFQALLIYLEGRLEGNIGSRFSVRRWIMNAYTKHTKVIKAKLAKSQSLIHLSFDLSFDLWTSRSLLSLKGIVVHFVDETFEARTFLLALPQQEGKHTGVNIADTSTMYGIEKKIGYFTLDNANNNDTCTRSGAKHYSQISSTLVRRPYDQSHGQASVIRKGIKRWRQQGPIGKLHRITTWIYKSGQRKARFHKAQETMGIKKSETLDFVKDDKTRWNSTHDMIKKAKRLKQGLDCFIDKEALEERAGIGGKCRSNPGKHSAGQQKQGWTSNIF